MQYKLHTKHDIDTKKAVLKPGNLVVTHGTDFFDRLIQIFTVSRWNHIALIVSSKGDLIEVVTNGIRKNTLAKYGSEAFYVVDIDMNSDDRKEVVEYAQFMAKKHIVYGFLTIVSIAFKIITKSRLVVKLDGTLICSEFVARALSQGGVIWDKDTSLLSPADLYRRFVKQQ